MTDLGKLEELEREATKGPWRARIDDCFPDGSDDALDGIEDLDGVAVVRSVYEKRRFAPSPSDTALIVALRNNAPAMIRELRELRAESLEYAEFAKQVESMNLAQEERESALEAEGDALRAEVEGLNVQLEEMQSELSENEFIGDDALDEARAECDSLRAQLATAREALKWCREMDEKFSDGGLILACNADGVDVIGEALKTTKGGGA